MNFPAMRHTPHCERCGSQKELMKHSKRDNGGHYLWCRPCNTDYCKGRRKKFGLEAQLRSIKKYEGQNPLRRKAWTAIAHLRSTGKLGHTCVICNAGRSHAHHPDLYRPLYVVLLCPYHHKQVHKGLLICPQATDYAVNTGS